LSSEGTLKLEEEGKSGTAKTTTQVTGQHAVDFGNQHFYKIDLKK